MRGRPPLSTPKPGAPVFITSTYFTTVASLSPHSHSVLHAHASTVMNHSFLLYLLFTSLTREAPPFHIMVRGVDSSSQQITDIAKRIGDPEKGTTFVSGMKTPEMTLLFDENGTLVRSFVDDDLMKRVGCAYVKKHAEMINVRKGRVFDV